MTTPHPVFRAGLAALAIAALTFHAPTARAQSSTPFWQQPGATPAPVPTRTPRQAPAPQGQAPAGQAPPARAATPPPASASAVIARVEGKPLTQADFDRVAIPYFGRMRAQLGAGFEGDIVKIANHNVLDELLRRELMGIEAGRQAIQPAPADVDSVLSRDPFFWSTGSFDRVKFDQYKSSPQSNYTQMLPDLKRLAAMDVYDRRLRERLTPNAADIRAEWSKRNDKLRYQYATLLRRDVSLEPEATPAEWEAYYKANPDRFRLKTRARLRYARLPLPPPADSTRAAEEARQRARASAIADSLSRRTLPDTSAELTDTGLFEVLSPGIPTLGGVPELQAAIAGADSDASVRAFGPLVAGDAVFVGVIRDREPAHVPPLKDVIGDARRLADADKRREAAEQNRRAFYTAHADHWKASRVTLSRLVLSEASVTPKAVSRTEIDRGYAQNGRSWLGLPDTSHAALPALNDSLRTLIRMRLEARQRTQLVQESSPKLALSLAVARDPRAAARTAGAVAETLSLVRGGAPDTLFRGALLDSMLTPATAARGQVQGPRQFGARWVAWRVEQVDTSFVPTFEIVRPRVEREFREDQTAKDEADAKPWFETHRTGYKTPLRFAIDYVAIPVPSPDSIRLTDADVRADYTAHRDRYRREEEVKARHILFMTRGGGPAEDAHARERADSLLKVVRQGGDFGDFARRFSQEPGAPSSGGDLGWFGRGRMVREFETAAFALKPGEISGVVKTQFGYHIIQLEDRRPAGVRPLEEVQADIRRTLGSARADSLALNRARSLRRQLAAGGNAATLTARYGGLKTSKPIAASEPIPELGFVQGFQADAAGIAAGGWAPKPYRSGAQYVVLRVRQRVAPHAAEFDEAKAQVVEDMKTERKSTLFDRKVAEARAALLAGASLDSVAGAIGGLKDSDFQATNAAFLPGIGFGPHIMDKLRAMKSGLETDTLVTPAGVMWARVKERKTADPATLKQQREQLSREILATRLNDWLEEKKKTVHIEVLRRDLREPKPGPYKTVTMGG